MKFNLFFNIFFSRGNWNFHIFQPVTVDIVKIWNIVSTAKVWNIVSTNVNILYTKMMNVARSEQFLILSKIVSNYSRRIR